MEAAPPNSQRKVLNKNLNLVLCLNKGFYDMKKPFPHDAVTCNGSCLPATIITSELMYYAKDNKSKLELSVECTDDSGKVHTIDTNESELRKFSKKDLERKSFEMNCELLAISCKDIKENPGCSGTYIPETASKPAEEEEDVKEDGDEKDEDEPETQYTRPAANR